MLARCGLVLLIAACADSAPPEPIGRFCVFDHDCRPYVCEAQVCAFGTPDSGPNVDAGRAVDSDIADADADADAGTDAAPTESWASGNTPLIAVLSSDAGIWVVSDEAATLLDADATEIHRFAPGRVITAAAFRDGKLYVVDRAEVAVIEGTTVVSTYRLPEWCGSAVPLSDNRLVCVHGERESLYTLIDLSAGIERSSGFLGTVSGGFLPIPNEDRFLGIDGSEYRLFGVVTDEVTLIARYSVNTSAVAFAGSPATRLVTGGGRMLWLDPMYCTPEETAPECLDRAGDLGVLPVDESYISMTSTPDRIYGLLQPRTTIDNCESGACVLHEVDSVERRLLRTWEFNPGAIVESDFGLRSELPLVLDASRRRVLFAVTVTTSFPEVQTAWSIYLFELD